MGGGGGDVCSLRSLSSIFYIFSSFIVFCKNAFEDVFYNTVFVKFMISIITLNKILMKHIKINQKSIGKSIPAYGFLKSIENL